MWLILLCVLWTFVVWASYWVLALLGINVSVLVPVLLTLLAFSVPAMLWAIRRWRAAAAARALEREILAQADAQAARTRPDRRAEVLALKASIEAGLASVKRSRLGARHGSRALFALPWYAIIGPPGAGKTTALKQSGLEFPQIAQNGAVRGVGGTRNCDWWFSTEAILLDTAGRYTTEEDDREEWLSFLGMLKRNRPGKPLNGLIVAVSITDFVDATEEQVQQLGVNLRARVDEVLVQLETILPVYLVFTKCDLVAGFVETWDGLTRSQREQVLGATPPLGPLKDPRRWFEEEMTRVFDSVRGRALRAMPETRQADVRAAVFRHPLELSALHGRLAGFVGALFRENPYQESPIFRGFFFTSGTQEGAPIARVMAGMARAFGLPARTNQMDSPVESKAYFVTDLFRKVIFPEAELAVRSAAGQRRDLVFRVVTAAAMTALACLLVIPACVGFWFNWQLLGEASAIQTRGATLQLNELDQLAAFVDRLGTWERNGHPWSHGFGMYVGGTLYPAYRAAYLARIRKELEGDPRERVMRGVRSLADKPRVSAAEFGAEYERLKLYLMASDVARLEAGWVSPRVAATWGATTGRSADVVRFQPHVERYFGWMKEGVVPLWGRQADVVDRARSTLVRAPQVSRMYDEVVRRANERVKPIRRESVFYGPIGTYVSGTKNISVQGAFTKDGWAIVRELLDTKHQELSGETWVLGEVKQDSAKEVETQLAELRERYFQGYKLAWRDFLADIVVEEPKDTTVALKELEALSEAPDYPYQRLLALLRDNVTLEVRAADVGEVEAVVPGIQDRVQREVGKRLAKLVGSAQPAQEAPPPPPSRVVSPVERAFAPMVGFAFPGKKEETSGLELYQTTISGIVGELTNARDAEGTPDTAKLQEKFDAAVKETQASLTRSQNGFTRPLLSPLLLRPIRGAWGGVAHDSGSVASGLWEVEVWDVWDKKLAGRYPFSRTDSDASLEDFVDFFKLDGGKLWSFYGKNLSGMIKQEGVTFTPKRRVGSATQFAPDFLGTCLTRGAQISAGVFPPGSLALPKLELEVRLSSVSDDINEVSLDVDGVAQNYKNEPETWRTVVWPAEKAEKRGATMRVRGWGELKEEVEGPGDFGLFRLFDSARIQPRTSRFSSAKGEQFTATWRLRSEQRFVTLEIRVARSGAAVHSLAFDGYKCPRSLGVGR